MYSGRLASQVAMEAIEEGDTSASYLERYLHRLREGPVGQEFIGGEQLRQLFELLGDPEMLGELTELAVDLTVNMLMQAQEPKVDSMVRMFPILADNIPVLMGVARIYLPILLRMGSEKLRKHIRSIKGLERMAGGEARHD